jgi:hypothetical protein
MLPSGIKRQSRADVPLRNINPGPRWFAGTPPLPGSAQLAIFRDMEWRADRPAKRPGIIEPCIPTRASKPPVGPQWIHEMKHDGYRLIARMRDGSSRVAASIGPSDIRASARPRRGYVSLTCRSLVRAAGAFRSNLNLASLQKATDDALGNLEQMRGVDEYRNRLNDASVGVRLTSSGVNAAIPRLSTVVSEADKVVADLTTIHETPEARTVELWKRIALGVIICTFLLAIMRYASSIYKEHHAQALRAEADDLLIRQFVVVFKSLGEDAGLRKEAIMAFMSAGAAAKGVESSKDGMSSEEAGIFKELIGAISKRIM